MSRSPRSDCAAPPSLTVPVPPSEIQGKHRQLFLSAQMPEQALRGRARRGPEPVATPNTQK